MGDRTTDYEAVVSGNGSLEREFLLTQLGTITNIFRVMDQFASQADGRDDDLMELMNSLADLLRGGLTRLYGIDIRPVSELGAFDDVEVEHTMLVLQRVLRLATTDAQAAQAPVTGWTDENRQQVHDEVLQLESDLQRFRADLLAEDLDQAGAAMERITCRLDSLHASSPLRPGDAENRPWPHLRVSVLGA